MDARRVAIFAGGTGGHVYPAMAVASELHERGYAIEWFGTERGLEARVVPEAGYPLHALKVSGIRGKGIWPRLKGLMTVFLALGQAFGLLRRVKPVCALGMGGYASGPAGLAARMLRIPLVIHEQNSVAGTTNRLLRRFATAVLSAYPGAFGGAGASRVVGNPVRSDLLNQGGAPYDYDGSRELRLFVLGGSLGAKALNEILPQALAKLPAGLKLSLRHQTGPAHADSVRALYGADIEAQVEILPYIEDMAAIYSWADLVLCRAGALTVSELAIMGRPSILVPLPNAIDNHQYHNAAWLAEQEAAVLLPQSEMTAQIVAEKIAALASDPQRLKAMANAALAAASPMATRDVADICEEVRRGR